MSSLVRPLLIELAHEGIEAILLLQAVESRRPGRFLFEGEVHALMAAILLRMARLDAFDRNAEPHRQLREIEQSVGTGKGHAVVGADSKRQPALAEQPLKGGNGRVFAF